MAASENNSRADEAGIDRHLLRRIVGYLAPYKGWVALALTTVIAASFFGAYLPKLVQEAIDGYIVPGDLDGLQGHMMIMLAVLLGEGILAFINTYLTQWIGQHAIYDLRNKVFQHIQNQPLAFFDGQPIGRLITRTTSDVESLSDVLSAGVVTILGNLFRLAFITYFMFALNWLLAVVTLLVMPLMVWATFWFRRKVRDQYRETRKQIARINAFIQEHVTGMSIVQVFNREREEMRRFKKINDEHRAAQVKTIFYFALFWPMVDIIASAALGLVLWVGGVNAMVGTLTLGVLIAFIQYARMFFMPIRNLSDQYNTLQRAMAGAERIFDVLDQDQSLPQSEAPTKIGRMKGRIEFRNVWFSYDAIPEDDSDANWVLKDVTFTVEPGQTTAFVGATGAGKSTIINLLLRFYEIQRGQICIDGIDIREYALTDLRRHIGLVLQNVFLFSGSVERNITLEAEGIDPSDVRNVSQLVGAEPFIEKLPKGYQQDIRERGLSLSHGQRQLLSFARALLYDPEVLVLDEATSSVDTETEFRVQEALETLMEGRTALVIAHRLSTIRDADNIMVLHKGEIREQGTHEELLKQGGLYRKLYELQYRDQEAVA